jgi:hypothetical protein
LEGDLFWMFRDLKVKRRKQSLDVPYLKGAFGGGASAIAQSYLEH